MRSAAPKAQNPSPSQLLPQHQAIACRCPDDCAVSSKYDDYVVWFFEAASFPKHTVRQTLLTFSLIRPPPLPNSLVHLAGMSVNPAASGLPGTSQQPNIDPEGTIIDWLRREAALEKEFPYLKRKRSDGARSTDSLSTSSTSSTTGSDDEDDKLQGIDLENDCTGIAGQVRVSSLLGNPLVARR